MSTKRVGYYLVWLTVILSALLLIFKVVLTSDSLFVENVYRNLMQYHGRWDDWIFTPAPAYFPDVILYFVISPIVHNPVLRIFLVSFIQVIMLAAVGLYLLRAIVKKPYWLSEIYILAVTIITVLASSRTGMWLYFETTNNHYGVLFSGLLSLAFLLRFLDIHSKRKFTYIVLFALVNIFAIVSDLFFVTSSWMTTFITCGLLLVWTGVIARDFTSAKKYLSIILTLIFALIVALVLSSIVTKYSPVSHLPLWHIQESIASLKLFLQVNVQILRDHEWSFRILFALFIFGVFAAVLYLIPRKLKSDDNSIIAIGRSWHIDDTATKNQFFCVLFLLVLCPINWIGTIFSGAFRDAHSDRYFIFTIAIAILLTATIIDKFCKTLQEKGYFEFLNTLGVLTVIGLAFLVIFRWVQVWPNQAQIQELLKWGNVDKSIADRTYIVKCVDQYADAYNLHSGIGNYWDARMISLLSDKGIWVTQFDSSNVKPFFWQNSIESFFSGNGKPLFFNFAIMEDKQNGIYFTTDKVGAKLPKPSKILHCKEPIGASIWVYNGDEFNTFIKNRINTYFLKFAVEQGPVVIEPSSMGSNTGHYIKHAFRANPDKDKAGVLMFGPFGGFTSLNAGDYKVTIKYALGNESKFADDTNSWNVIGESAHQKPLVLASGSFKPNQQIMTTNFTVPKGGVKNLQVRAIFGGKYSLAINLVEITKV